VQENGSEYEDENDGSLVQCGGNGSLGEFHPCQPHEHRQIRSKKRTADTITPTATRKDWGEHLAAQWMK